MIQSHYFVERMVQERPQELLRVARSIGAARAARQARAARRATPAAVRPRPSIDLASLADHALTGITRALLSGGEWAQRLRERRFAPRIAAVSASCVICGEPLPTRGPLPTPGTGT